MRPVSGGLVDRPGDSPGKAFPGYLGAYGLLGSGVGLSVVITLSLTAYFIVRLSIRVRVCRHSLSINKTTVNNENNSRIRHCGIGGAGTTPILNMH